MEFFRNIFTKQKNEIEKTVGGWLNQDIHRTFDAELLQNPVELLERGDRKLNEKAKALLAFSRLLNYFEGGVALTSCGEREIWTPEIAFKTGHFYPSLTHELAAGVTLPAMGYLEVLKANPQLLLQRLELDDLLMQKNMDCYLLSATPEVRFVLLSKFQEPFNRVHFENICKSLRGVL